MTALTRAEAETRVADVERVDGYDIHLDVTDPETFRSTTTIRFVARGAATFVEVICEELLEARLDGAPVGLERFGDERLPLTDLAPGPHELVVVARMRYSYDGEGLHRFVDPEDGNVYLCATSSIANGKRWFACFDQPDLKAPVDLRVDCPPDWSVLGNGAATRTAPGQWQLATTPPIATYLVTVCAGAWHSVLDEHDGIPLGLHVRASLAGQLDRDAADLFGLTADAFDAFHELFGIRYPFGRYDQAFVPEFNWGAMENPGCVTLRDQMIFRSPPSESELDSRTNTIVHEMAHMWFGDLVTMRWWDDLWLNESFAEYLAHEVTSRIRDIPTWDNFAVGRKAWGYAADRRATTHPVAGNGAVDNVAALDDFDGISYAKGASVLRQLAAYLGEDAFLDGLRDYIATHQWGNATFADLVAAWAARVGGTGDGPDAAALSEWAQQWLRTAGVDVIAVDPDTIAPGAGDEGSVGLRRLPPPFGPPAQRPHAMSVAVVPGGPVQPVLLAGDRVDVPLGAVPGDAVLLPDAGDQTWATVRLAPQHWSRLTDVLSVDALDPRTDGTARGVLWNALRTAMSDGLVAPSLAVRIVLAGLPGERDVVATQVLAWARVALPRFLAPGPARDEALAALAGLAGRLLDAAAPGSRGQLSAARSWLALSDDVEALRRWSDDETTPAGPVDGTVDGPPTGLEIDDELRWSALERRAALGDLDTAGILAAAARDRSASGAVHAQRCRALRPDVDAKAAAWSVITDASSSLSHYQLAALAGGIWVAGQEDLIMPYAQRWFTDMPAVAAFRVGWSLSGIAELCFPSLAVAPEVRDAALAFASRTDVPSGLRRIAGDGADELCRAIAVRERADE